MSDIESQHAVILLSNDSTYETQTSFFQRIIEHLPLRLRRSSQSASSSLSTARAKTYIKCALSSISTIILTPFAVCDIYFAFSDDACVNQNSHHLSIIMHSYLLANGIITIVFICGVNMMICNGALVEGDRPKLCKYSIYEYILKLFGFGWLITGCVLFWGYTNESLCSRTTYNYLFTRFIFDIVCYAISVRYENNNN